MNKISLFILSVLLSPVLSAQDTVLFDTFFRNVSSSMTELTYTYTTRLSGINSNGQGTLLFQDAMWKMDGNGVQMYCDSATVWVVDCASKEVVIEPVSSDSSETLMTNPALIVAKADRFFSLTESLSSKDGKAMVYALKPKEEIMIESLNMEIWKSDATLRRAWVFLTDGNAIKIEVSSMKLTSKVSTGSFKPGIEFDSEWIVTDLR